jgi:two-component system, cell cycle sensor histidine kinase and response regulator CckA
MPIDVYPVLPPPAQDVLVHLVRLSLAEDGSNGVQILERLTELAASGLNVARASVWLRDEHEDAIICQDLFVAEQPHSHGMTLCRKDFLPYFAALDQSVVIPAEDAHRHSATACFSTVYLKPLGIGAMLDAPIWRGGKAVGVLCLEHVGGVRRWSDGDQAFAAQVALICGLYYERQERLLAERALREREEVERQHQKMEALGRMACSIGHDFNNLLTTIIGQTEFVQREGTKPEEIVRRTSLVLDAANRAGALVKRLLTFGKGREVTEMKVDLVHLVRSLQPILRSTVPKRIFLDLRLPDTPITVLADVVSVEQVLVNLVVNARDAIVDHGTIFVTVRRGVDDAGGSIVVIKVVDTGCGMDAATLARAFDPFFTTKGERGTGLGLSTCFTNMQRMGGRISITSSPGQGTTCACTFPASE